MQELKENYKFREEWLMKAKDLLQKNIFRSWEFPEGIKVSCGDLDKKHLGCCFSKECSENQFTEIFISPSLKEETEVLGTLAHELIHAFLGNNKKHGKEFGKVAEEIGLLPPWRSTKESDRFKKDVSLFIEELGKYPHAKINRKTGSKQQPSPKSRMYVCKNGHDEWKCLVKEKYYNEQEPVCPICGKEMEWEDKNKGKLKVKENLKGEIIVEIKD